MRRSEEKPGKEATRLHSEKHSCPRRRDIVTDEVVLCRCFRCEPERGGKAFWDAEQLDRDLASRWIPRLASEAFCPRKARVRPLRTGKHHICFLKCSKTCLQHCRTCFTADRFTLERARAFR